MTWVENMGNGGGVMPRLRPGISDAQGARRTLIRVLLLVLLALSVALGAGAPATAADGDLVKVFVVPDPAQSGGSLATLQSVATSTLGDAGRAGEIFTLNRGQAQSDGSALNNETDPLHPGWILRLPPDASGPDVQTAKETGAQSATAPPQGAGQGAARGAATTTTTQTTVLTVPLPVALAAAGAVLLGLVTAGILLRRQVRKAFAVVGRGFRKLGDPARRRRRFQARRSVGQRFASDADSVRRAYRALDEFAGTAVRSETPVHALRVDPGGVTVWVTAADKIPEPWQHVDSTRWRRAGGQANWLARPGEQQSAVAGAHVDTACLVRVGTDDDGEQVFVDLSRLDGILTVTGDHAVARDLVRNLLAEISRSKPSTPVTVLRGTDGAPPIEVPPGLNEITRVAEGQGAPRASVGPVSIRGAAARRPVKGLVVMAGTPTARDAQELAALCGPGGAGWTGLVCGESDGAHWRWQTDADGSVDIPVLGVTLTVPA